MLEQVGEQGRGGEGRGRGITIGERREGRGGGTSGSPVNL